VKRAAAARASRPSHLSEGLSSSTPQTVRVARARMLTLVVTDGTGESRGLDAIHVVQRVERDGGDRRAATSPLARPAPGRPSSATAQRRRVRRSRRRLGPDDAALRSRAPTLIHVDAHVDRRTSPPLGAAARTSARGAGALAPRSSAAASDQITLAEASRAHAGGDGIDCQTRTLLHSAAWQTASTLWPSRSRTKAP
jgi:hypothetical protein